MKERRTGGERESERDGEKAAEIEKHDESEMAKGEGEGGGIQTQRETEGNRCRYLAWNY